MIFYIAIIVGICLGLYSNYKSNKVWQKLYKECDKHTEICKSIIYYDYEDIDQAFLGATEIKDKHIYPKNSGTTTYKNIKKNHHKKLT